MNKTPSIGATLSIFNPNYIADIMAALEDRGRFTHVPEGLVGDLPKLCLVILGLGGPGASYVCILNRGQKVATNQRRLLIEHAIKVPDLEHEELLKHIPKKLQKLAEKSFGIGCVATSPRVGELLYGALLAAYPDYAKKINTLWGRLSPNGPSKTMRHSGDIAGERDALGLGLDIFGVDRGKILKEWDPDAGSLGRSFLTGLTDYIVYEDDALAHDLSVVPGWDVVKREITGVVEFEKDEKRLVVINANRKPLERALGIDLIYFHRTYEAFTLVQYKMVDRPDKSEPYKYYDLNSQGHTKELERMRKLTADLKLKKPNQSLVDYRFSNCPIFFKLCGKLGTKIMDGSLTAGAYIPLDQWELLLQDKSTLGPNGGRRLSFDALKGRYLGTNDFVGMVTKGFVGTVSAASKALDPYIEASIRDGHSVVYAIEIDNPIQ